MVFDNPQWDLRDLNWDTDVKFTAAKLGPILNAVNPDLRAFRAHGGKLIQYHGWKDYMVPPLGSINYYGAVAQAAGGFDRISAFYRLFMVPGMEHCSGGPGPSTLMGICQLPPALDPAQRRLIPTDAGHDLVAALVRWVEQQTPPNQVIATTYVDGVPAKGVARTWLLCPYPSEAHWTGANDRAAAANYVCVKQ
jgi:feruloyl esterase